MYRQADNTEISGRAKTPNETCINNQNLVTEKSRETRHMMRRIAFEIGADSSDLIKYNQLTVSVAMCVIS